MPPDLQQPLRQVLRGLGDELRATDPPAALRERIVAAVQATPVPALAGAAVSLSPVPALVVRPRSRFVWASTLVMAILALVFMSAVFWSAREPGSLPIAGVRAAAAGGSPFVALVSEQRLRQLAREPLDQGPPWVVTTELPRERLAAFGLPFDPARAGESVRAELLMHPAGEVLAVRIVR